MNRGTPSSSALAHTGWNFGSENSRSATLSPMAAPFKPGFFAEQRAGFVEMAMGMHVDRLDPFSADHDREFLPCRFLAVSALEKAATAEDNTGSGGRTSLEKITACGHDHFLPVLLLFSERNCALAHYGQRSHATWRRQGVRRHPSVNRRRERASALR